MRGIVVWRDVCPVPHSIVMRNDRERLIVHFVGSIPLADSEAVFRALSRAAGMHAVRLPDGETGVRQGWIRYLQDILAAHPAIEVAAELPPFRFVQWDGTLVREIPRLRVTDSAALDPGAFETGYAAAAIESWNVFEALQRAGVIGSAVRFQICLPTPTAPTYNNMQPGDRPAVLAALTAHLIGEVGTIAAALPHERIALQWDVCQEVLAWEGYYEPGPVDFRDETLAVLHEIGDAVPERIDLGYHLCYGSPADEHIVQPKDAGLMVEIANAVAARVGRPIQYVHLPVPKARTDDAYFMPLAGLEIDARTDLYLGLVHHDDAAGDAARLAAARRHARVDGVAAECGLARGDPSRLDALLAAHVTCVERFGRPAGEQAEPAGKDEPAGSERPGSHEEALESGTEHREADEANEADEPVEADEADEAEEAAATLSPSVRRLVKQYGLDVSSLRGSGPGGRLRVGDVMALLGREGGADEANGQPRQVSRAPDQGGGRPAQARDERAGVQDRSAAAAERSGAAEPGSATAELGAATAAEAEPGAAAASDRAGTHERAAEAVATTVFECDATRLLENQRRYREQGREIVLSAYFAAGLARALHDTRPFAAEHGRRVPVLAVESPRGAEGAHVLTDADSLTVEQISVALNAPAVPPGEPIVLLRHHGVGGSLLVQPDRLEAGHLAVLGIGRIRRQVVVRVVNGEEAPRIASQCLLSLTFRTERLGLAAASALLARCVRHLERWPVAVEPGK